MLLQKWKAAMALNMDAYLKNMGANELMYVTPEKTAAPKLKLSKTKISKAKIERKYHIKIDSLLMNLIRKNPYFCLSESTQFEDEMHIQKFQELEYLIIPPELF